MDLVILIGAEWVGDSSVLIYGKLIRMWILMPRTDAYSTDWNLLLLFLDWLGIAPH